MADYTDVDPYDQTRRKSRYAQTFNAIDPNQSVDTGIPVTAPTGGINPGGMYSSTATGVPSAPSAPSTTQPSASWHTDQYAAPRYTASGYGNAMAGWDAGKWADPNHQTPKYAVGRILSQFPATVDGLSQAMAQIQQAYPGATWNGKDKVTIPGVGTIDVLTGASVGGTGWAWQDPNVAGAGGGAGMGGGGGYGLPADISARLMQMINQPATGLDSPVYQQAMSAYNTQAQRNAEHQRGAIAERMAASGQGNSGALDAQLLGAEQAAGEAKANFAGQLGLRALEQQRQEIMNALQLYGNLMTEQQRLGLQEKLGMIDAGLRGQGLGLQQQQITNQQNQFNSEMGWNQAMWEYLQNQSPWNTTLGM